MFLSIGVIIIDDIILPDGTSKMAILGGGSTHAVMGMRVWSDQVALVAPVGHDFPPHLMQELQNRFDTRGIIKRDVPTTRCWELFETDGTRHEIVRTDIEDMLISMHQPEEFPETFQCIRGVHLHAAPHNIPVWVEFLRSRQCPDNDNEIGKPIILWEPWDPFCKQDNYAQFCEIGAAVDIVSPNLRESRLLTGLQDPQKIAEKLLADGIHTLVIRMGADGSMIAVKGTEPIFIPAVRVDNLVDVTGAGNAYCGGYIVGFAETQNHLLAGRYAAVAASFSLEQFGAVYPIEELHERAKERLNVFPAN